MSNLRGSISALSLRDLTNRLLGKTAGGKGALLAFLLAVWVAFFGWSGASVLIRIVRRPDLLVSDPYIQLFTTIVPLLLGAYVARSSYRQLRWPLPSRIAAAAVVGLSIVGAAWRIYEFSNHAIPIVDSALLGFLLIYSTFFASLLFLLLWSSRSLLAVLGRLMLGPERLDALLGLARGLLSGAVAAGLAATLALIAEGDPRLILRDWFYVLAMPALMGFGVMAPPPRRPSVLFTVVGTICAVGVAAAVIPEYLQYRHWVPCTQFWRGGGHTVLDFEGEPWNWERPNSLKQWLIAPVAFAELTFWHVVDPVTEADCSTG